MDTPEDIARDEWYSNLVSDISQQAIDQFTLERLRSYFVAHASLATDAFAIYDEALKALTSSQSAALVLATTAMEVGLKVTLLKPVVYGLVHNETVADLVSDLVVKNSGFDRFNPLITRLVTDYGGIDLKAFKLDGGRSETIWTDIATLVEARNAVVHRAKLASLDQTTLAMQIAGYVLGMFLPSVLKSLGLKLDNKNMIVEA